MARLEKKMTEKRVWVLRQHKHDVEGIQNPNIGRQHEVQ
jgi:hypothetical protein